MRNIAERGKGSFTYIGKVEEVGDRMQELFLKLENPLLTDIRLSGSSGMEMFPDPIPDLYLGEPVTLIAKTGEVPDRFVLSGYFSGSYWEREINARVPGKSEGISILWARQKIKALMDSLDGGGDREQVRAAVIETAQKHHLVSRYTSLVAVDVIPVRPGYEDLAARMVKTGMPRGWQYGKVFGLPQTATVAELCLVLGGLALFLSAVIWLLLVHERVKACVNRKS
jgi:Ca-activated chloride channel family protein